MCMTLYDMYPLKSWIFPLNMVIFQFAMYITVIARGDFLDFLSYRAPHQGLISINTGVVDDFLAVVALIGTRFHPTEALPGSQRNPQLGSVTLGVFANSSSW